MQGAGVNPQNIGRLQRVRKSLLGKTWGEARMTLKLKGRFDPVLTEQLVDAGHEVEAIAPYSDLAGHAGAVVLHRTGLMEGASDPRSDGAAVAY